MSSERQTGVIKSVNGSQVSVRRVDGGEFQVDILVFGQPAPQVDDRISYLFDTGTGVATVDARWRATA